jgi:hypothetical protein
MSAANGNTQTAFPAIDDARTRSCELSALADADGRGHVTPTPTPDPDPRDRGPRLAWLLRLSEAASHLSSGRPQSAGGAMLPGRALGLHTARPTPGTRQSP